jgi:hypothetical protein
VLVMLGHQLFSLSLIEKLRLLLHLHLLIGHSYHLRLIEPETKLLRRHTSSLLDMSHLVHHEWQSTTTSTTPIEVLLLL